jgi:hypothetical protein
MDTRFGVHLIPVRLTFLPRTQVIGDIEKSEYGQFGWFMDPDGNKVELWQPPD